MAGAVQGTPAQFRQKSSETRSAPPTHQPKVVIVHDWLTNMGGAERVVLSLAKAYPDAPIYTSVYEPEKVPLFKNLDVRTTYIQRFPRFLRRIHQLFPVIRAHAFRSLDLSEYDVVISSASAEAKAVQKRPASPDRPAAVHVCYCHTPTRYYWSHYKEYLANPGFGRLNPLVRLITPPFVWLMRKLDLRAAAGVDYFIANSTTVAARIKEFYHRQATVIHPPVNVARFAGVDITQPREGFVVVGRQVPYKKIDLPVKVCSDLFLPLTVYGRGSEHQKLVEMAGPTVHFIPNASDDEIAQALARAEAFIFPSEEDFGIVQVEAMAAGTPVIAYGVGGARDAVVPGKTGVFFERQTPKSLALAVAEFKKTKFDHGAIQHYARQFEEDQFIKKIWELVKTKQ